MKTMIRLAAGLLATFLVGVSTQCAPYPVEVRHVHHYDYDHTYDGGGYSPSYQGSVNHTPNRYSARSFEPVERF